MKSDPMTPFKRVQILDSFVAERIAAGEVIERPSSVVKELVENSLDAGATEVAVILEDGGKALIEVIDNGHGIHADDLAVCLKRHATSKLSTLDDLERLNTLGFRGEALPSVAAAADLSLISRTADSDQAYELIAQSGARVTPVTFGHFLGSSHGTRIQARGLFSQIPARLKFLKAQAAEVGQVREWLERLALSHPHVSFRLVSNDRTVMTLKSHDEVSRVRAILSDGEDYPIVSVNNDLGFRERQTGDLHVRVHWLQGLATPQMRKLVQVVNGRAVRDRMLQQALLAPFRQTLLPGQFPAVALFVEIDPSQIDVNVHPTKTEIRFLDSRKIFQAVQSLVEAMISQNGAPAYAAPSSTPAESLAFQNTLWNQPPVYTSAPFSASVSVPIFSAAESTPTFRTDETTGAIVEAPTARAPEIFHPLSGSRFAGILFNTYIMYDAGSELVMVDQHAAHERIRFEALRDRALRGANVSTFATIQGNAGPAPQALLVPEAVQFDPEARATLESRLSWLAALGFEAELFGENTVLFRSTPTEWGMSDLRTRLKNLVERTLAIESSAAPLDSKNLFIDESLFEKLASEACHSAIRAGDRLRDEHVESLVKQLFACEHPWNCPHGRPTVARVPRGKLEEWFQRRANV